MTFLIDSALKMSVVLGAALLAMAFLRKRSAALRHWVLSAAILCAALIPVGMLLLPAWNWSPAASRALSVSVLTMSDSSMLIVATPMKPLELGLDWPAMVWLAGSGMAFLALALGVARLMRAARLSERVVSGDWCRIAQDVSRQYGLRRRVGLLQGQSSAMLVTWGALRPKILLPAGSELWPEERMSVVLQHELAHVRRNDWLLHTAAELLRVVYWFNPLLWLVCRRLRLESEYAADNAVLAQGVSGSRYAAHLLEIVRGVQQSDRAWSAASAMARPSTIERRFSAMLNSTADRRPIGRVTMAAVAIFLLCTSLSLAALSGSAPLPIVAPAVAAAPLPIVAPPAAAAAPAQGKLIQDPQAAAPTTQYTGEMISLDLKNVEIKDFFRLIGDIGGFSVVLDRDVTGQITVQLKEVPWDQALDIVARNNQLGLTLQGKVLQVSSRSQAVLQGRIVMDFEVLKNGKLLGQSRIATTEKVTATVTQDPAFTISVTPMAVAANKVELDLGASVGDTNLGSKFRLSLSKDIPGKIIWESGGDSYEIRVMLAGQ